ncbi:MAG: DUF3244 domain-containing protein [Bacteroidales bacterium]|nr:DUF3244 domain-containing protein [Bacteroidales bacterium]
MKKTIILMAALFMAICNCFALPSFSGDDEVIPLECSESELDTIIIRTPAIPIQALLDSEQSIITVFFLYDMGVVSIDIMNTVTGEEFYYEEASQSGSAILPFFGGSGYYYIRFRTINGPSYYGYFYIE